MPDSKSCLACRVAAPPSSRGFPPRQEPGPKAQGCSVTPADPSPYWGCPRASAGPPSFTLKLQSCSTGRTRVSTSSIARIREKSPTAPRPPRFGLKPTGTALGPRQAQALCLALPTPWLCPAEPDCCLGARPGFSSSCSSGLRRRGCALATQDVLRGHGARPGAAQSPEPPSQTGCTEPRNMKTHSSLRALLQSSQTCWRPAEPHTT